MAEKKKKATYRSSMPLVSIVTPAHNVGEFFSETINTVCNQSYENWEWIIVDDGSEDNTSVIIKRAIKEKREHDIRLIELKTCSGAANARNMGIKAVKGDYLCFLDADDLWKASKLEKQVKFMKNGSYAFSFTGYEFADAEGRPNGKKVSVPNKISYRQALRNTTIWTSTVMLDMKKLTKKDVLMPNIASEDTATWWNILHKVECAYGLNEVLSYYRRSSKTLSSNKLVAIRRIWNLYRKHERLGLVQSSVNFVGYAFNAVRRRV